MSSSLRKNDGYVLDSMSCPTAQALEESADPVPEHARRSIALTGLARR
jgi:hypothetical protein